MKRMILLFGAAMLSAADPARTFTGVITDTMCGAKPHELMLKDKPAAECVKACARGRYFFALYDGSAVMKLSDQKTPAKYAAQRVKVTGTYDEKQKLIRVVSIEPEN